MPSDWLNAVKMFRSDYTAGRLQYVLSPLCAISTEEQYQSYRGGFCWRWHKINAWGTSGEPPRMIHGRSFQRFLTVLRHQHGVHLIKNRLCQAGGRRIGEGGIDFRHMSRVSEKPYYSSASGSKVGREIALRFIS